MGEEENKSVNANLRNSNRLVEHFVDKRKGKQLFDCEEDLEDDDVVYGDDMGSRKKA